MFFKFGKYSVFFVLFIFIMTITADAFTAIRQEELGGKKPMTRAQRKAQKRKLEEHPEDVNSQSSSNATFVHHESSNNSSGGSSANASNGNFVRPSETPKPTPTVDKKAEQEKRDKARKTSNTIVIIFVLLVIGGLAGWYFTRNVNFKKLK